MTKSVLVLGGDGMLGHMLKRVLGSSGRNRVVSTDRRREADDPLFLDVETGPVRLRDIWREQGPFDYAVNCIGIRADRLASDGARMVRSALFANAVFPHLLADHAAESHARVVHVSTDAVFAANAGVCVEDTPVSCTDPYGQTKALGEASSPAVLNLRCSLVGPDSIGGRGILEWLRRQPDGGEVTGYTDRLWTGVTTLQFSRLCETLIEDDLFEGVRNEGETHHFCPNETVSKYQLLKALVEEFRPDLKIAPAQSPDGPSNRVLATRRRSLPGICGSGNPLERAVSELTTVARARE